MSAVQVNARSQMDQSCNWRCCFGCKDKIDETVAPAPSPSTIVRSPESLDLRQIALKGDEAVQRMRRQIMQHEVTDGALDVEFDAVHIRVRRTPDNSVAITDED